MARGAVRVLIAALALAPTACVFDLADVGLFSEPTPAVDAAAPVDVGTVGDDAPATSDATFDAGRDGATFRDARGDVTADGPSSTDARSDATADAGSDADAGLLFACPFNNGTVADCAACTGYAFPCWFCAGVFNTNVTAACRMTPDCTPPNGTGRCSCGGGGNPSACPGALQTCAQTECRTCGESNTNGRVCKGGGACAEQTADCK